MKDMKDNSKTTTTYTGPVLETGDGRFKLNGVQPEVNKYFDIKTMGRMACTNKAWSSFFKPILPTLKYLQIDLEELKLTESKELTKIKYESPENFDYNSRIWVLDAKHDAKHNANNESYHCKSKTEDKDINIRKFNVAIKDFNVETQYYMRGANGFIFYVNDQLKKQLIEQDFFRYIPNSAVTIFVLPKNQDNLAVLKRLEELSKTYKLPVAYVLGNERTNHDQILYICAEKCKVVVEKKIESSVKEVPKKTGGCSIS